MKTRTVVLASVAVIALLQTATTQAIVVQNPLKRLKKAVEEAARKVETATKKPGPTQTGECHSALFEYNPELSEQLNQLLHNPYLPPRPFEHEVPTTQRPCRSLIVVRAALERDGSSPDLIRSMKISVADVGLAIRSKQATYELIADVQSGTKKQQLKNEQQQPKIKM